MSSTTRQIIFWIVVIGVVVLIYKACSSLTGPRDVALSYTQLLEKVNAGEVKESTFKDDEVTGVLINNSTFNLEMPNQFTQRDLVDVMREKEVNVRFEKKGWVNWTLLFNSAPLIIFLGLWIFMMRQMQSGGNRALSFGKSSAKLVSSTKKMPTFNDIAGAAEAKEALQELVDFLRNPDKWNAFGGKIPKGCLLVGPPGCGKTLLARAVAGEAGVPFFTISGAEFVEMFVGVGASRVRNLFEQSRKNAPCVLFIDELDAVGRKRGSGIGGGHDEREQTLNQLLVAMDGFEENPGVVVLAATNRPDVLDKALVRPGRFDRQIKVPLPTAEERIDILNIHTRAKLLSDSVDLGLIAEQTPGYGGADLANLANEAALQAIRRSLKDPLSPKALTMADFDRALELIRSGREIFSSLDLVLIESATQLAEPMEQLFVRLFMSGAQVIEGELIWSDSTYIKYRSSLDGHEVIVPKSSIWKFELLTY